MNKKARVIAFYLPQFHPIKENNEFWGNGFTEWTNVAKARPYYRGHYQPQIPADLGFYDLRMPEIRKQQAKMAREAGIEGFCYWHYWFGNGRQVLERPFNEVLESGDPDFPFCLGWANHSWSNRTWQKTGTFTKTVDFITQEYPGVEDYVNHFNYVVKAFKDKRYIQIDGKPVFLVYAPYDIPDTELFISTWNKLAVENGFKGVYFIARVSAVGNFKGYKSKKKVLSEVTERFNYWLSKGYDAVNSDGLIRAEICADSYFMKLVKLFLRKYANNVFTDRHDYRRIMKHMYTEEDKRENIFPQLVPRWDKTPRAGKCANMYKNNSPEAFGESIELALETIKEKKEEHKVLFLFAWNEWGEGAYMEPDIKHGHGYLDILKEKITKK